uniref:Uncharacterized protein n=1 Tax=Oryza barthii TaxID=65489 RepID=A0A0D3HTZ5_9ORYZ
MIKLDVVWLQVFSCRNPPCILQSIFECLIHTFARNWTKTPTIWGREVWILLDIWMCVPLSKSKPYCKQKSKKKKKIQANRAQKFMIHIGLCSIYSLRPQKRQTLISVSNV